MLCCKGVVGCRDAWDVIGSRFFFHVKHLALEFASTAPGGRSVWNVGALAALFQGR
jgi:hypothetical protein